MNLPKPIINAHTHIFHYKDIPPYIAKQFIPWPLYILTHVHVVFWFYRFYAKRKYKIDKLIRWRQRFFGMIKANFLTNILWLIFLAFLGIHALVYLLGFFLAENNSSWFQEFTSELERRKLVFTNVSNFWKLSTISLILILPRSIRRGIIRVFSWLFRPARFLTKSETFEFIDRYLKIASIVRYEEQKTAYHKLKKLYPTGSHFVVLTMDMEFMRAGRPRRSYLDQLKNINDLYSTSGDFSGLTPFLFVDPRRIRLKNHESELPFFDFSQNDSGEIILKPCLLKKYLERIDNDETTGNFWGIKIYPALGYYPFDEDLLALWLYCAQNAIPITSHCIIGTIFYRGRFKKEWFKHPVFEERRGEKLKISGYNNYELQKAFTHPLNYLVLLEESFLAKHLDNCRPEIQKLFGYSSGSKKLDQNLSQLKINFAHYGGDSEWLKYMDEDRQEEAQEFVEMPDIGIRLMAQQSKSDVLKKYKPAQLWHDTDWFSLISSLLLQYDHTYADLSYTIHNDKIRSLLKFAMSNKILSKKILFGTDFHVVRSEKSDKEFMVNLFTEFHANDVDKMAIENPKRFLSQKSRPYYF